MLRKSGRVAVDKLLWHGSLIDKVIDEAIQDPDAKAIVAFNLKVREDECVAIGTATMGDRLTLVCKL